MIQSSLKFGLSIVTQSVGLTKVSNKEKNNFRFQQIKIRIQNFAIFVLSS